MKSTMKFAAYSLLSLGLLVLASCTHGIQGTEDETIKVTPEGAMIVDTFQIDATISAIDKATRTITLTQPGGGKTTVKAGKGVANFDQLNVGDKVHVTATETVAVDLRKAGAPPSEGVGATVSVAAHGKERDIFVAGTAEVTAKVTAIDVNNRKVTLQFVDGSIHTFRVGRYVDMHHVEVGEDVMARVSESVAVDVTSK